MEKLIRDRIPEIASQAGEPITVRRAGVAEIRELLHRKLAEEVDEFLGSADTGELVDILEALYAVADYYRISADMLENMRAMKAINRGRFRKRFVWNDPALDRDKEGDNGNG